MKLTIKEEYWYRKFIPMGLDSEEAELMARFKYLRDEFMVSRDVNWNYEEFINPDGPFYQFCIESGRLTSDEINAIFHNLPLSTNNPIQLGSTGLVKESSLSLVISKAKKINMLNLIH